MKTPIFPLVATMVLAFALAGARAQSQLPPGPAENPTGTPPPALEQTPPAQPPPVVNPNVNTDLTAPAVEPPKTDSLAPAPVEPKKEKPAVKKPPGTAFSGKLEATDRTAMSLTVVGKKSREYLVTSHTRFTRAGKPATFTDATIGEDVAGYAKKNKEGKWELLSLRYGAKVAAAGGASKPAGKKSKTPKKAVEPATPAGEPAPITNAATPPVTTLPPAPAPSQPAQ